MTKKLLSKAQTLKYVESKVSLFEVPDLLYFKVSSYRNNPTIIIDQIKRYFKARIVVIRSSAADEDGKSSAAAGEYDSVLNVASDNEEEIIAAINSVISSFEIKRPCHEGDEFIIQEMVQNSCMSGVIFTHDLNTGAPYYVINYDDVSGLTDTVTSGDSEYSNRTLYVHRDSLHSVRSERFQRLLHAIDQLEKIMDSQFLDVEFALSEKLTPYLLQVRSITTQPNWNGEVAKRISATLKGIQSFVKARLCPMEGVYGKTSVLGQMPDWNPIEMIGRAPRALAFSLYKILITDNAWRIARKKMGYAIPVGHPLMVSLAGQPFIDTRLSFHSYLPDKLPAEIGEKLVDVWVQRLRENPELHDKVEFDVAITTYSFDIDKKIKMLIGDTLNESEKLVFKENLKQQTYKLIRDNGDEGGIVKAIGNIKELTKKYSNLSSLSTKPDITKIYAMIDECIRLGTVPFSILARHGFIARTILLSLNNRGILAIEDVHSIQSSIHTVASDLVNDMHKYQLGELSHHDFMNEYGHLRPGTYDILSSRYDQMPDLRLNDSKIGPEEDIKNYVFSELQKKQINILLKDEGFSDLNAESLLDYIHAATVGREYGKFVFTRSVSDMLEIIANYGAQYGLSKEVMSHISLDKLLDITSKSSECSIEERLRRTSKIEAEKHEISSAIRLSQVLFDEAGVHVVPFQVSQPNFITHKKTTATCVSLLAGQVAPALIGKIVLIESADPGFDWIFSQKIAGLITKYGGANSHMAIRCAEFGIPAAIGCGEQRFEVFIKANKILLDCAAGLINPTH